MSIRKNCIILGLLVLVTASTAIAQQPLFVRNDDSATVLNGVNGRTGSASVTDKGVVSTSADTVRRATFTHTQPSVLTATSFTCLATNTLRRMATIQNNSGANILINLNAGVLTGIVPTATNLGIVLTPGSSYTTPPNAAPTVAITCYQTSGGTINTISVVEQS